MMSVFWWAVPYKIIDMLVSVLPPKWPGQHHLQQGLHLHPVSCQLWGLCSSRTGWPCSLLMTLSSDCFLESKTKISYSACWLTCSTDSGPENRYEDCFMISSAIQRLFGVDLAIQFGHFSVTHRFNSKIWISKWHQTFGGLCIHPWPPRSGVPV